MTARSRASTFALGLAPKPIVFRWTCARTAGAKIVSFHNHSPSKFIPSRWKLRIMEAGVLRNPLAHTLKRFVVYYRWRRPAAGKRAHTISRISMRTERCSKNWLLGVMSFSHLRYSILELLQFHEMPRPLGKLVERRSARWRTFYSKIRAALIA